MKQEVPYFFTNLKKQLRWLVALLLLSISIGLAAGTFLWCLDFVTNLRIEFPFLLFGLPFAGWLMVWYYEKYVPTYQAGTKLLVNGLKTDSQNWNFFLAPTIFISTILTHLFGGSAGREGTALQIAAGIQAAVSRLLAFDKAQQKTLLRCALAAGFSAIFGVPFAGLLFAFEVDKFNKTSLVSVASACFCALLANSVALLLPISHTSYQTTLLPDCSFRLVCALFVCALAFGFTARLFIELQEKIKIGFQKITPKKPLQAVIGGSLVVLLVLILQTDRYLGLGVPEIEKAFLKPTEATVFGWKLLFTAITLAAGFKGGEVTPLFFIGATLGSFLAMQIGLPIGFGAAMGFVAVFGSAAAVPLTCAIMSLELFGADYFYYALPVCIIARFFAGKKSVYT